MDPTETWSLATVITLCGVYSALPVVSSQQQPVHQAHLHHWLHTAVTAVQHYILSWLQRSPEDGHANKNLYTTPLDLGDVVFDTRGMWANALQSTSWAFDHLFLTCKQTSEMVAIQVSTGSKLTMYPGCLQYSRSFVCSQHELHIICVLALSNLLHAIMQQNLHLMTPAKIR